MFEHIKDVLATWLLADRIKRLDDQDRIMRELHEHNSKLTVTDLVREQLKGFDPKMLDSAMYDRVDDTDILSEWYGEDADEAFLANVKSLRKNTAFEPIINFLIRNQILYTTKEAPNAASNDFGRATINGLVLFREEVDRLCAVYEERHKPDEEFDAHAAV